MNIIKQIRNKIVAHNSQVTNHDVDKPELVPDFEYFHYKSGYGGFYSVDEPNGKPQTREITNGDDIYYVTTAKTKGRCNIEGDKDGYTSDSAECLFISVQHGENKDFLCIVDEIKNGERFQNVLFGQGDKPSEKDLVSGSQSIDINDINSIRYQLRKHDDIAHFLDKFVIVAPEEKKAYNMYNYFQGIRKKLTEKDAVQKSKEEFLKEPLQSAQTKKQEKLMLAKQKKVRE